MELDKHKNRYISGVNINAVGSLDGTSIYDVDLDSVEDKPWRKPGADITDYFNYGFNE
ncbi:Fip1 motif-domain-containing protein [Gigaspora rosea]|uniref:Fip1 motif-domain-containing protein n=1 Tax=Gigaspora rosea TaxID=44941 RepID=A0A397WAM0_9GLOM|nr:Fip1 motif-domain-containing protein [Gigaspora rosea]